MKRPIKWFLDVRRYGQLDLEPPYQRRSVWTLKDRKNFLDTVFRGYPCPAVFLHKEFNRETEKIDFRVVDGKQRLETLILFCNNELALDPGYGDPRLDGKKWRDIETDPALSGRFLDYGLMVEYLDTDNKYVINEVFERLNKNSRKLERQELRHAKYDGWFITTAEREAEREEWERLGVVTKARIRRMKDVQCISELLATVLKNRVVGFNQDTLDAIYAEYDAPYETSAEFNEVAVMERFRSSKEYVLKMEDCDKAVSRHAKGFNDLYSLWAFVALNRNRLPSPETVAGKYAEFMSKVSAIGKTKDINLLKEYEGDSYADAYAYLKNSGHSTADQPQREARNSILARLLASAPVQDEETVGAMRAPAYSALSA